MTPRADSTDWPCENDVQAEFNVDMNSSTVNSSTFTVTTPTSGSVTGDVSYIAATKTATFNPDSDLSFSTTYTVTLEGVKSSTGTRMTIVSWEFTTVAQP